MGNHAACELLDTISPQFFADLFAWGMQINKSAEKGVSWFHKH